MSRDATAVVAIEPPARGTFGKLLAAVTAKPEGMQPRHLTLEFGVELPEVLQAVSPLLERQLSFEYRPSRGEPDAGAEFRFGPRKNFSSEQSAARAARTIGGSGFLDMAV